MVTKQGQILHATCIAARDAGDGWRAVMLRGVSGAGKSDLALRMISRGWSLVADDQVHCLARDGGLYARPVTQTAGLLEVRGLGLWRVEPVAEARVVAVVDLVPRQDVPRMPESVNETLCGVALPLFRLHSFDVSAPDKVARVLQYAQDGDGYFR